MKKLLFAMAIGAGLAWMYDPESGSRRREGLRKKLDALSGSAKSPRPTSAPSVGESFDGHSTSTSGTPPTVASLR